MKVRFWTANSDLGLLLTETKLYIRDLLRNFSIFWPVILLTDHLSVYHLCDISNCRKLSVNPLMSFQVFFRILIAAIVYALSRNFVIFGKISLFLHFSLVLTQERTNYCCYYMQLIHSKKEFQQNIRRISINGHCFRQKLFYKDLSSGSLLSKKMISFCVEKIQCFKGSHFWKV